ncbi:protein SERAC1-like [Uloborus diversus]|uniref:protein SERAC1-like n=1 Tax=Uloborus diversus TaxID=327109 RepID=UPI00240A5F2D|nr:protein SERAC1-like [Uloborus diversus]
MFWLRWHRILYYAWTKKVLLCGTSLAGYYTFFPSSTVHLKLEQKEENEKQIVNEDFNSYTYLPHDSAKLRITWERDHFLSYWNLLELSKSKDPIKRHKAVESLTEIFDLEEWEYQVIAQASSAVTAVGLARTVKSSPLFFLPSRFKNVKNESLNEDLMLMFLSLPLSEDFLCIKVLIKQTQLAAKTLLKYQNAWYMELDDQAGIYHSLQKKKAIATFHKASLEAILACSAVKLYRDILKKLGILELLFRMVEYHENDLEFHSLIAQVLANFALDESSLNEFHITGWIGILSKWARLSSINVSLPAIKALANLDVDDILHAKYDDGIYLLSPVPRQRFKNLKADVVFVHGLLGATFWTWRQNDNVQKSIKTSGKKIPFSAENEVLKPESSFGNYDCDSYTWCWPKDWLAVDLMNLRVIGVDYRTCLTHWNCKYPQIKERDGIEAKAKELSRKLLLANVGERPIVWVTHSMGGLLVKQILLEANSSKGKDNLLSKNTVGVIFYSVPHKGSGIASWFHFAPRIFLPSIDILQLQKETPSLLSLHENFKRFVLQNNVAILSFGETKKSSWGLSSAQLVTLDSSDPGFGDFYKIPVEHLSTCKPFSRRSIAYRKVVEFLITHIPQFSSPAFSDLPLYKNIREFSNLMSLIP